MWTPELTDGFYQWARTRRRGPTTACARWTIWSTWSAGSTATSTSTRSDALIQWRGSGVNGRACITRGVTSAFAPTVSGLFFFFLTLGRWTYSIEFIYACITAYETLWFYISRLIRNVLSEYLSVSPKIRTIDCYKIFFK